MTQSIRRSLRQRNLQGVLAIAEALGKPLTPRQLNTLERICRAARAIVWQRQLPAEKRLARRMRKWTKKVLSYETITPTSIDWSSVRIRAYDTSS